MLKYLLTFDININFQNIYQNTALHNACVNKLYSHIEILLDE